jgi:sugar phosphate isomerase/epimerase
MMKFGAMNFPVRPILEEIEQIGEAEFDFVEITMDPPEASPRKLLAQRKEIRDLLDLYGMDVVGHLPTFVLTADLYESLRKASVDEMVAALHAGAELGMKKMVIHPGFITGLGKYISDVARTYAMESVETILKASRGLGVTLCIENMIPQAGAFVKPQEFQDIFERFPDLRFVLDIAHANIGEGRNRSFDFIQRFAYRTEHVHASDNYGKEDNHLPIGAGLIDFEKIFRKLKAARYDGTLTLEVFSRDRDYLRISRDKLRALWNSID